MTTETILVPESFTKGSGKRILAAANKNGWEVAFLDSSWGATAALSHTVSDQPVTITVSVCSNGSFGYARSGGFFRKSLDSLTDTLNAIGYPTVAARRKAEEENQLQSMNRRAVSAEAARAEYFDKSAWLYQWKRESLTEMAAFVPSAINVNIEGRSSQSILSDAESVAIKLIQKELAEDILRREGTPIGYDSNDCVTAVQTLPDAVKNAVMDAMGRSSYTDRNHCFALVQAIRDLRYL